MSIRKIWLCATLVATATGHAQEIGPESYKARREALMQMLDGGVAVMYGGTGHTSSSGTGLFYQEASFHYLTGIDDPGAANTLGLEAEGVLIPRWGADIWTYKDGAVYHVDASNLLP